MLLAVPAAAQEFPKTIMTGSAAGTYIQFGRDISREMQSCGLTLDVQESAGSLENFLAVRKRPNTQFGIVQSDVLEYLKTYAGEDPSIARAIHGVRIAFPLYNEEVHILAKREIADLQDLTGRRIAVGAEESGTFLTASLVLDLADVQGERVTLNAPEALQALLADQIDAFFYVAGAPTKLFEAPEIDPERFHLLPIDDPTLREVYLPAQIPAGTYPFQKEAVDVVAVKAVLMTYEYTPNLNSYHRESCKAVSDLANVILTRFGELQSSGHPKWKNVDLNDLPPGWDVSECVNAGLAESYSSPCENAEAEVAPAGSAANSAYRTRICAAIGC
jgi:TRAP transporter TAXI family solute receptor